MEEEGKPTPEDESSKLEEKKPTLEDEASKIEESKPTLEDEASKIEESKPTLEDEASKIEERKPTLEDEASKIEESKPTLEDEASKIEESKPTLEDEASKIEESKPTLEDEASKIEETKPSLEDEALKIEERKPSLGDDALKMEEKRPILVHAVVEMEKRKPASRKEKKRPVLEDAVLVMEKRRPAVKDDRSRKEKRRTLREDQALEMDEIRPAVEDHPSRKEKRRTLREDQALEMEEIKPAVEENPLRTEERRPPLEGVPLEVEVIIRDPEERRVHWEVKRPSLDSDMQRIVSKTDPLVHQAFDKGPLYRDNEIIISDVGVFAYLSLVALTLPKLFDNKYNWTFNSRFIHLLSKNMNKKCFVMRELAKGCSGQGTDIYVDLLREEPNLRGRLILLVQDVIMVGIRRGSYDSRVRVLAKKLAELLEVDFDRVEFWEQSMGYLLDLHIPGRTAIEETIMRRRYARRKLKNCTDMTCGSAVSGSVVPLAAGIAVPITSTISGLMFGTAAAMGVAAGTGLAFIASMFGLAGWGLIRYTMKRKIENLGQFSFEPLHRITHVGTQWHLAIAVSGHIENDKPTAFREPWLCLNYCREQYALRYETEFFVSLKQWYKSMLLILTSETKLHILERIFRLGCPGSYELPKYLLSMIAAPNNPWSVLYSKSDKAGKHLAEVLLNKEHGSRPVTLLGYSLGARVIFSCLETLADSPKGLGIIQDVVIIGAPISNAYLPWEKCASVVAGKIINGYSSGDFLLEFLYRSLEFEGPVAGLSKVDHPRVTNIDLTEVICCHDRYTRRMPRILYSMNIRNTTASILKRLRCHPLHRTWRSEVCLHRTDI